MASTHLPLTLIVATTPSFGIGVGGALPWPPLRNEMAYFARVTRRVPAGERKVNAVLMGRKTWDSIPTKFRPLKGRLNVVISRTLQGGKSDDPGVFKWTGAAEQIRWSHDADGREDDTGLVICKSLEEAIDGLNEWRPGVKEAGHWGIHRVFVIGGSQIYHAALQQPGALQVLRTKVLHEFECDVQFPLHLGESSAWKKVDKEQFNAWAGEIVPEGIQTEKDVSWEFEMWEKNDTSGEHVPIS